MDKKISGKKLTTGVAKVVAGAHIVLPIFELANEKYEEGKKDLVDISDIYPENRCIFKDGIEDVLNKRGLSVQIKPLIKDDANAKYHNYRESQIVKYQVGKRINPKYAKIGSIVSIDYITKEVIDESIRLYEEEKKINEEQRKEKKQIKENRKERRKNKKIQIKEKAISIFKKGK